MSFLTSVRPFFRTRLNGLGFSEWKDGFQSDNIPRSLLDGAYHIESGLVTPTAPNQQLSVFDSEVVVRVFFKGFRSPADAIDKALEKAEVILSDILQPDVKHSLTCIKDIRSEQITVEPLAATNDNSVILTMNFTAVTYGKF